MEITVVKTYLDGEEKTEKVFFENTTSEGSVIELHNILQNAKIYFSKCFIEDQNIKEIRIANEIVYTHIHYNKYRDEEEEHVEDVVLQQTRGEAITALCVDGGLVIDYISGDYTDYEDGSMGNIFEEEYSESRDTEFTEDDILRMRRWSCDVCGGDQDSGCLSTYGRCFRS